MYKKNSKQVLNSSSDLVTTLDHTDSLDHANTWKELGTKTIKTVTNGILGKQLLGSDHMIKVNKLILEAAFA